MLRVKNRSKTVHYLTQLILNKPQEAGTIVPIF